MPHLDFQIDDIVYYVFSSQVCLKKKKIGFCLHALAEKHLQGIQKCTYHDILKGGIKCL